MRDLAVAGIDSEDRRGTGLKHAVGKAAGGGSDIDAMDACEIELPMLKCVLEFETAAADVFEIGAEESDDSIWRNGRSGLVDSLLVDENTSSKDQSLRTFARGSVALIDEKFVETRFHQDLLFTDKGTCSVRYRLW